MQKHKTTCFFSINTVLYVFTHFCSFPLFLFFFTRVSFKLNVAPPFYIYTWINAMCMLRATCISILNVNKLTKTLKIQESQSQRNRLSNKVTWKKQIRRSKTKISNDFFWCEDFFNLKLIWKLVKNSNFWNKHTSSVIKARF